MTTGILDWLESKYFYRTENGWKHKDDTPKHLIKQFNNFMKNQKRLYG